VTRLLHRLRSDAGQTAAEYLGVLLVVSVVIAALALTTVGDTIRTDIECTVRGIVGEGCTDAEKAGVDPECLLSSNTREANFSVNVVAVKVGEGNTLIEEHYADGRIVFTLVDNAEVAAELLAGAKAHVGRIGFNASASLAAGGKLEGARVFEFKKGQETQADKFRDAVKNEGTFKSFLHDAVEGGGGGGLPGGPLNPLNHLDPFGIKDKIADKIFGDDADDLGDPSSTYVSASVFLSGDGQLAAGIPGLDAELTAAAKAAGGVKVNTSGKDAGTAELSFELSGEANGSLGVLSLGPNIGGKAKFTAVMTLSKRKDGSYGPSKLRLVGTAGYDGAPLDASQLLNKTNLGDLKKYLEGGALRATEGSGKQIEFAADLDLNDPENLRAALSVLNPTGTVNPQGVADLVGRIDSDGRLTLQNYDTTASDNSAEVKLGAGINGGLGGGQKSNGQELTSAMVRDPGKGFEPRSCGLS
jgi:hypothetical protein